MNNMSVYYFCLSFGIVILSNIPGASTSTVCDAGYRLQGHKCVACDNGYFMPHESHTNHECWECDRVQPGSLEVVETHCTQTTDIQKICTPGVAFRHEGRRCKLCDECADSEVEKRPCTEHSNRECAPRTVEAHDTALPPYSDEDVDNSATGKDGKKDAENTTSVFSSYEVYLFTFIAILVNHFIYFGIVLVCKGRFRQYMCKI